jgi:hypothetical protein
VHIGDNAYLNTPYMATPYAAVLGGTKDAYNFYHSQLRIRIECTFGMLTHRWAILQSAIPMNVTVHKTVALILALAKLHNYCIDADDGNSDTYTASDEWQNELNGAVPLVATTQDAQSRHDDVIPEQLVQGGHHFDDIGGIAGRHNRQRRFNYMSANDGYPYHAIAYTCTLHLLVLPGQHRYLLRYDISTSKSTRNNKDTTNRSSNWLELLRTVSPAY